MNLLLLLLSLPAVAGPRPDAQTPGAAPVVAPPLLTPIGPVLYPVVAAPVAATPVSVAPSATLMPAAAPVVYPMVSPTAPGLSPGIYTVKKGAHLAVIAQRTGTSLTDLIRLNPNLRLNRLLPAGTKVLLPIPGSW
jgi:hypothetical protein